MDVWGVASVLTWRGEWQESEGALRGGLGRVRQWGDSRWLSLLRRWRWSWECVRLRSCENVCSISHVFRYCANSAFLFFPTDWLDNKQRVHPSPELNREPCSPPFFDTKKITGPTTLNTPWSATFLLPYLLRRTFSDWMFSAATW